MSNKVGHLRYSSWSWNFGGLRRYIDERVNLNHDNASVVEVYQKILDPCLTSRRGQVTLFNSRTRKWDLVYVSVRFNRSEVLNLTDFFSALGWFVCVTDPLPPFDARTEIVDWLNLYYTRLILFSKLCYTFGVAASHNRQQYDPRAIDKPFLGPHVAHLLVTINHFPQGMLVTDNSRFETNGPARLPFPPAHQYALSTNIPQTRSDTRRAITAARNLGFEQNHKNIRANWRDQSEDNDERPPGPFPPGMCAENPTVQSEYRVNGPLYAFGAALVIDSDDYMTQTSFPSLDSTKANSQIAIAPCQTCQNLFRFTNITFHDIATGWVYGPPPETGQPLGPAWKLFHRCQLFNCKNDCQNCDPKRVVRCPKGCVASWCKKDHFDLDKAHAVNCYAEHTTLPAKVEDNPQFSRYQPAEPPALPQTGAALPHEMQQQYSTYYDFTQHPTRHFRPQGGAGPSGTR